MAGRATKKDWPLSQVPAHFVKHIAKNGGWMSFEERPAPKCARRALTAGLAEAKKPLWRKRKRPDCKEEKQF
jgi:hypothetical protein